jgi:hypothetical protein
MLEQFLHIFNKKKKIRVNNESWNNAYQLQYTKHPITLGQYFTLFTRSFYQQHPMNMGPILNGNWAVMVHAIRSSEKTVTLQRYCNYEDICLKIFDDVAGQI